jgi:hypothetical protein
MHVGGFQKVNVDLYLLVGLSHCVSLVVLFLRLRAMLHQPWALALPCILACSDLVITCTLSKVHGKPQSLRVMQ